MDLTPLFTSCLLLLVGAIGGATAHALGTCRTPPEPENCLTPENQAAALEILLAAVRTPALAQLRPKIERVLTESGYAPSCAGGKRGRIWRRRAWPQFAPDRYRHEARPHE